MRRFQNMPFIFCSRYVTYETILQEENDDRFIRIDFCAHELNVLNQVYGASQDAPPLLAATRRELLGALGIHAAPLILDTHPNGRLSGHLHLGVPMEVPDRVLKRSGGEDGPPWRDGFQEWVNRLQPKDFEGRG